MLCWRRFPQEWQHGLWYDGFRYCSVGTLVANVDFLLGNAEVWPTFWWDFGTGAGSMFEGSCRAQFSLVLCTISASVFMPTTCSMAPTALLSLFFSDDGLHKVLWLGRGGHNLSTNWRLLLLYLINYMLVDFEPPHLQDLNVKLLLLTVDGKGDSSLEQCFFKPCSMETLEAKPSHRWQRYIEDDDSFSRIWEVSSW